MPRIVVVGVGSPFGDDKVGWEVVKLLRQSSKVKSLLSATIKIEVVDRPGPHLLNIIDQYDTAIIIDAAQSDYPAGTILRFDKQDIQHTHTYTSSHDFGVLETIALGKAIDQLPEQVVVYGLAIVGGSVDKNELGQTMAVENEEAIKRLVDLITEEMEKQVIEKIDGLLE